MAYSLHWPATGASNKMRASRIAVGARAGQKLFTLPTVPPPAPGTGGSRPRTAMARRTSCSSRKRHRGMRAAGLTARGRSASGPGPRLLVRCANSLGTSRWLEFPVRRDSQLTSTNRWIGLKAPVAVPGLRRRWRPLVAGNVRGPRRFASSRNETRGSALHKSRESVVPMTYTSGRLFDTRGTSGVEKAQQRKFRKARRTRGNS
jgi:hypothetical protein